MKIRLVPATALLIAAAVACQMYQPIPTLDVEPHAAPSPSAASIWPARPQPVCPNTDRAAVALGTTICDILQRPAQFMCARVRVRATFVSDCFEHSCLLGGMCQRCIIPESAPGFDEMGFNELCNGRHPGHASLTATFTGRVRTSHVWGQEVMVLEIDGIRLSDAQSRGLDSQR